MFRLLRYYVVTSLIAFILAVILLGYLYNRWATGELIRLEQEKNVALATAMSNSLRTELSHIIADAPETPNLEYQQSPHVSELRRLVATQMQGQSIVKVKVYALDGLTVFSTESAQIGEDKSDNVGFQAARGGEVTSGLTHRDSFNAFERTIANRDVLSSYIPLHTPAGEGEIAGVFELYSDVTPLLQEIGRTQQMIVISMASVLGILYLFLLLVVRRADRIIISQSQELALAKESAEDANKAKSAFVSFVSHELRTPVSASLLYTDLLKHPGVGDMNEQQAKYLEAIRGNIDQMTKLLSDLTDISRLDLGAVSLNIEAVSLPELIADVTSSMSGSVNEKHQALTLDITDDLPPVQADRDRLQQIMTNLLSNATKYTPDGGEIGIAARQVPSNGHGEMIEISVSDNGLGISEQDRPRIFERFFRAEEVETRQITGTGLGLHITKKLTELQGGSICFDSEVGEGTTFHLLMPVATKSD